MHLLKLYLERGKEMAIEQGFPWIYAGDIRQTSELELATPGELAEAYSHKGELLGVGSYTPRSPIAFRLFSRSAETIDIAFFERRLHAALQKREALFPFPYYRLVHSEADGLPGLLIDRFGDTLVMQLGTAGMERLRAPLLEAVERVVAPAAIVLRNDTSARAAEGLKQEVSVIKAEAPPLVEVREPLCRFLADLVKGQKTGWFYDQRDNRVLMAEQAKGKTVLDVFSHSGGFGIPAAVTEAAAVTMVDSSALALDLAMQAAKLNGVEKTCATLKGDAFAVMEKLHAEGKCFDVVLADPPAFVKSRKDIAMGMKGYAKVARAAAALLEPGGLLFIASCSHHATRPRFEQAVREGAQAAGRTMEVLKRTGAAPDHPVHPHLPQSEYLKGLLLKVT